MDSKGNLTKLDIATWGSFIILAMNGIIVAISLPEISRSFNTNLAEGGGIATAKTSVIFVVLLIAGVVAQRWGKKRFLTLGQYLLAGGLLLASFAPNYAVLVLALMIAGIGVGFSEALLNPLITDIHDKEAGRFLNLGHAFYPVGIVGSALLFGELLTLGISWRFLFQIAAIGALAMAIMFTALRFPAAREEKVKGSYAKLYWGVLATGGYWIFALAILLGGAIEAALTFWSRSYVDAYLSEVPRAGAIALMIFAAAMAIGRFLSAYLANHTSLSNIMIGSALLGVGVTFMIPLATTLAPFYAFLGLAGLAIACFWPTVMADADDHLTVNTTILFVLLACAGIIGFGFTPWIMGMIGDYAGLRAGFAIIPYLFIALILVLIVARRWSKKAGKPAAVLEKIG